MSEAENLANERFDLLKAKNVLSKRTFNHKGMEVEEYIVEWDEGKRKLLWVKPPLENTIVDGVANPVFHKDYIPAEDTAVEEVTRRLVKKAFEEYWKLT